MKLLNHIILALILACSVSLIAAQDINALNSELSKMEQEKQLTTNLISKTRSQREVTVRDQKLLQAKIKTGNAIISNLDAQSKIINSDIRAKSDTIALFESDLERLRREYGNMIYEAYKNYKINNFMVFLFSSQSFNDINRRIAYMRQYNRMRERKAAQIMSITTELNSHLRDLTSKKEDYSNVIKSRNTELAEIKKDEATLASTAKELQKRDNSLTTQRKAIEKSIAATQKKIDQLVAAATAANRTAIKTDAQREQDLKLSGLFDQNRGKLPYPVQGVIVDRYGTHEHPTRPGVIVNRKQIEIAIEPGTEVRSVFDGVVAMISMLPNGKNSVILRHGDYFSVYGNLEDILVKVGDNVTLNQIVGKGSMGGNPESSNLMFAIWKDSRHLNPELWLRK